MPEVSRRVAGRDDEDRGPGPQDSGDGRQQPLERGGGVRRQARQEVQDALCLARRLGRRQDREPALGTVVARGGEAERRPFVRERPGEGRGDDEQ